ncbi:glycosyl transferase [Actinoplanes teichomyceticus]|nr:glycosyl transferase [Actinoplanes teichomyceticus]
MWTDDVLGGRSAAIVHEWYGSTGGAELVFRHIAGLLPAADRYALWADRDADVSVFGRLRESWLASTPLRHSKALALPLMPLAWRTLTRQHYDVVLSSSHAFAHTVRIGDPRQTRHLSYVHTPARYIWSPEFDERGANPLLHGPRRILQAADRRLSRHVHAYATNSREVRQRIQRFWKRDAEVIYPPVDAAYFGAAPEGSRDYLLGLGRWIPYKNFDLMMAIAEASGRPLVIAGHGPDEARLRRLAAASGAEITIELRPDRARLRELYAGACALLFPVHEDFGIIPVEAQAAGTPIIGLRRGGLLETVIDGETGVLVDGYDPAGYVAALDRLDELDPTRIRAHAQTFAPELFAARMNTWIADALR